MKTTTNTAYYLQVVFLALIIGIGLQVATAWTSPTSAPPSQSVTAPITVGTIAQPITQTKYGALGVTGVLSASALRTTIVVTESTACAPTGLISTDANGVVLSCQGGIWKSASKVVAQSCPTGQMVSGFDTSGIIMCAVDQKGTATGGGGSVGATCRSGHYTLGGYVCDYWNIPGKTAF